MMVLAMSASSVSESCLTVVSSTSARRDSAASRRLARAPLPAWTSSRLSRFVSSRARSVPRSDAPSPAAQVVDRVAHDVEQLVVGGALALAEHRVADDVERQRDAGPDLADDARDARGEPGIVAVVRVVGAGVVRPRGRLGAGEDVAAAIRRAGVALDRLDQLLELGGDRVARVLVGRVGAALHDQVAGLPDRLRDRGQRLVGGVGPARRRPVRCAGAGGCRSRSGEGPSRAPR